MHAVHMMGRKKISKSESKYGLLLISAKILHTTSPVNKYMYYVLSSSRLPISPSGMKSWGRIKERDSM